MKPIKWFVNLAVWPNPAPYKTLGPYTHREKAEEALKSIRN